MVRRISIAAALAAIFLLIGLVIHHARSSLSAGQSSVEKPTLVLYCATDREIAQDLIDQFEKESGIHVDAKFDTEAAKAVGLVQAIRQEKSNPRCDLFWGGGAFFCTMLANDGCLAPAPYDLLTSLGNTPRDSQGRWLGFAAAYRVLIVNTDDMPAPIRPHSYRDLTDPRFKGHVGIANPLFGGMGAHVAALFSVLGDTQGRQWLQGLKANDCAICAGMADVRNRVASGELWFGITSTVDAHVAVDGGKPVVVVFPDQGNNEIGCMNGYNAAAIVAGAPHPQEAEKFLRFLMTTQTEKILADGPGQNVGMLPESIAQDVRPAWIPRGIRTMDIDWSKAVNAHPAALKAAKEILLDQ